MLIQFISSLCLCYCSTRLKACLQGVCDWIVLVFKVLQELINSSRSRFPVWPLLLISRPPARSEFISRNFLHAYACLFVYFVCVPVLGRPEYAANPNRCYRCNRSGHWAKDCSFIVDYKYFNANALKNGRKTNSLSGSSRFGGLVLALFMVVS